MAIPGFETLVNPNPKPKPAPQKGHDYIPGINVGRLFRRNKKQKLQYAATKRARRIGKSGGLSAPEAMQPGSLRSKKVKRIVTDMSTTRDQQKKAFKKKYAPEAMQPGSLRSKKVKRIVTDMSTTRDQQKKALKKKYAPKNNLGDAENKAMEIKAKQMNAQIKKDQEAKKASDFKTLMERWNYENDNANPKGGRSNYGSGWTVENVKKRNKARQQKTKMGR